MPRTPGNINFINVSSIPDFQIVAGKGVLNSFPMHVHEKFCMGTIVQGEAVLIAPEEVHHISAGHIYFLNPGLAHQIKPTSDTGFDHIVFCFGHEFLIYYWGGEEASQFRFVTTIADNPEFCKALIDFYNLALSNNTNTLESSLCGIFDGILPFSAFYGAGDKQEENEREAVMKVCERIKENCRRNMSLDELAACAAMSKFHFCRVFKQATGLSPYEFQLQARIKLAKVMLLNNEPIAGIAAGLGFADQSHFYRFFKRDTGLTPGEFIKMNVKV